MFIQPSILGKNASKNWLEAKDDDKVSDCLKKLTKLARHFFTNLYLRFRKKRLY
jgi:hypothetical protein